MKWWVFGGLILLLAAGFGVQYWRESKRPPKTPWISERYKVGHRWHYKHRPHEDGSTVVICKVERDATHGILVHVGVEGLKLETPQGALEELAHLPMTEAAMDASVTRLAAVAQPLPRWLDAYERWSQVYDRTTGRPAITSTISEGVAMSEQTMQRAGR